MSELPDSIGIIIPPDWVEVGVDEASFDERWAELRRVYRDDPGWSRTGERRLELFQYQLRSIVTEQRVVFCSVFLAAGASTDLVSGTQPPAERELGDPDPYLAGCIVSLFTRAELGTELRLTPDTVLTAYTAAPRGDEVSPFVNLEPPSTVDLPALGGAVRLVRVVREDGPAGEGTGPPRLFAETYMAPIADGEALCLVQFSTPNVEEASEFSELFGAIARTLRVFYEDTPTLVDEPVG